MVSRRFSPSGRCPFRSSFARSARVSYSAALQKQDRVKTYAGAYLDDHGFEAVMVDARQQLILALLSQHHPANSGSGVRRRSALREGPGGGSSVRALSRAAEFAKIARVLDDILRRAGRR